MYLEKFNKMSLAYKVFIVAIIVIVIILILGLIDFIDDRMTNGNNYDKRMYSQKVGFSDSSGEIDFGLAPMAAPAPARESYDAVDEMGTDVNVERKVIKTGNLQITVNDVEESVSQITADTSASGGFIQNSSVTENQQGKKSANLVLRVPANDFENLISKIKSDAKIVTREDINGREVTEQYTDLQADLRHNEAVEIQYLELLKQAHDVESIIAVRNKLDQVQGEIERLKGRLRYLDNQTEMSTITVYITSEVKVTLPIDKWQPWENTKESARQLIISLQDFVDSIVSVIFWLISLIPYLIVIFILYLLAKKMYKKAKNKQNNL